MHSLQRGPLTHISHVIGDYQVANEALQELRIRVQHVQQIVPVQFVDITVCQCSHHAVRLSDRWVYTRILAKYIVFTLSKRSFD